MKAARTKMHLSRETLRGLDDLRRPDGPYNTEPASVGGATARCTASCGIHHC